ncbi:MAG: low temperature requirement protein A [Micrococcales bacterium]|nr:low temperature requirement protein A [Micrococcales bacterium]
MSQSHTAFDPAAPQEVSTLELFFDLVYVFAISMLAQHLASDVSWRGVLETALLSLTVFTIWAFTTYESTMVLSRARGTRWALLVVMLLGLVMNASIPGAFGESPWSFVVPMLVIQLGRPALTRAFDVYAALRRHREAMIVWALVSAVPWIIGALSAPDARLWWWLGAVAIDVLGMRLRHPMPGRSADDLADLGFDAPHQVERTRLFLLICLGEAIVQAGIGIAGAPQHLEHLAGGVLAMLTIVCLWYLFFGAAQDAIGTFLETQSASVTQLRLGELATNGQQVLVLAFVAFAVGTERVVHEPAERLGQGPTALLFGGVAVAVGAYALFLHHLTGHVVVPLVVGAAVLVAAGGIAANLPLPGLTSMTLLLLISATTALAFGRVATHLAVPVAD